MSRAIILPVLTVLALAVQAIFGVKIPEEVLNEASVALGNVLLVIISLIGIFKDHNKKKEDEKDA